MAKKKKGPKASAPNAQAPARQPGQLPFVMAGRTLQNTFTELEREGKACLYELLKAAVNRMPRGFLAPEQNRRWNGAFHTECADLLKSFHRLGGTEVYGSTFQRAKARWDAEVIAAQGWHVLTEEEGRALNEQGGPMPSIWDPPKEGTTVPLANLFTYWIEEFTAEVGMAVEAFKKIPDIRTELQRITNVLGSFKVGTNGKWILERMRADAIGKDLLEMFEHAKNRLTMQLEKMPVGIHRDFHLLAHAVRGSFSAAIQYPGQGNPKHQIDLLVNWVFRGQSGWEGHTGAELFASAKDKALLANDSHKPSVEQVMEQWPALFLERVNTAVNQWHDNPELGNELNWLISAVRGHSPEQWEGAGMRHASVVAAQLECTSAWNQVIKGLVEIAKSVIPGTQTAAVNGSTERIPWHGSTIEFITIMQNLVKWNYVDLPSKGGKGDGNWTEYFRQLQQAFIVPKNNAEEFTAEGLANRKNGRPMGQGRAGQFEFPDASRKRAVKGK